MVDYVAMVVYWCGDEDLSSLLPQAKRRKAGINSCAINTARKPKQRQNRTKCSCLV